mmetsp:Transcript_26414/g.48323  ORF Transcript_26414/g.48323 Transcript_26414/m.48323 type:complete len:954 (+) Transcript_26414:52-2913(+)
MPTERGALVKGRRTASLPALQSTTHIDKFGTATLIKLPSYEPYEAAHTLCNIELGRRKMVNHSVGTLRVNGRRTRMLSSVRLPKTTYERGAEFELPGFAVKLPPKEPPPMFAVLEDLEREFPPQVREEMLRESREALLQKADDLALKPLRPVHGPRLRRHRRRSERLLEAANLDRSQKAEQKPVQDESATMESAEKEVLFTEEAETQEEEKEAEPPPEEPVEEWDPFAIPWHEDELKVVFKKFDVDQDQEVHREDLASILRYLGARPSESVVNRLVNEQTHYSTLNWFEFLEFVRRFREWDVTNLQALFNEADSSGDGNLDIHELHSLLQKLGYSPTLQTTIEAAQEMDEDGDASVSFKEFEKLREYLRSTGGFMKADVDELRALYLRAARCPMDFKDWSSRRLATEEMFRITTYLGYSAAKAEIERFGREVDADNAGYVSFDELLKIIKRIRDVELDTMNRVLLELGSPEHGLHISDLGIALSDLGYFVSEEAVWDILDQLGECEDEEYLSLEELAAFIRMYRQTGGFTQAELAELQDVFDREQTGNDPEDEGSIDALELGKILRWFGISKNLQQVQRMLEEIDFDGSGRLEFNEFVKLMRQQLQVEAAMRRKIFNLLDSKKTGHIKITMLRRAVYLLTGADPDNESIQQVFKKAMETGTGRASLQPGAAQMNIAAYEYFFKLYRQHIIELVRKNAGYVPSEVERLRKSYRTYDENRNGCIEHAELRHLITDYFPEAMRSKKHQQDMQNLLQEVVGQSFAGKAPGELNFKDFLWLTRKCHDLRDEADVHLEEEVVKEYHFCAEEVEGFRQLFSSNVNWAGELDFPSIRDMLLKITDLTEEEEMEIKHLIKSIHPEGKLSARFPQFLQLVKKLSSDNMLSVNDAASRVVKADEEMRQKHASSDPAPKKEKHSTEMQESAHVMARYSLTIGKLPSGDSLHEVANAGAEAAEAMK